MAFIRTKNATSYRLVEGKNALPVPQMQWNRSADKNGQNERVEILINHLIHLSIL